MNSQNSTLTINHPRTKMSLYGEIYGFYMLSTNFVPNSEEKLQSFEQKPLFIDLTNTTKTLKKRKRQVETFDPMMNPDSRRPFFRIRNFLKFIRRVVSFVTMPIFRFAGRLISPWRRRFITLRPTSSGIPVPASATEIITGFRLTKKNATTVKNETTSQQTVTNGNVTVKNETASQQNTTTKTNHNNTNISKSEKSIVIYEIENDEESMELRQLRNTQNRTQQENSSDSSEIFLKSAETSTHGAVQDKCILIEKKFNENYKKSNLTENIITTSTTESSKDAITQLGVNLLFTQLSYTCCSFSNDKLLISWDDTPVILNNVVIDTAAGCGIF